MPTDYKRKSGSTRGQWRQVDLESAFNAVQNGTGVNAAAKAFSIPSSTLKRRLKNKKMDKGSFGRSCVLGVENEKKIVLHIRKLQSNLPISAIYAANVPAKFEFDSI